MTLKTLENALDVLSYFTIKNPEWGLRNLAREMDMNHTVLNRILKTYESKGYLIQNEQTKTYMLGLKFMEFSSVIRQRMRLSEFVVPVMKELVTIVDEAVYLTLRDGNEGVTVEIAECLHEIKYTVSIGSRTPLYIGASCKAISAFLTIEEQNEIVNGDLEAITNKTVIDSSQLLEDFKQIRERGWSHTQGEFSESVTGISVPLFNKKREVIGSLTVAGPSYRMSSDVQKYVKELKSTTSIIERYFEEFNNFYN